MNRQPPFAVSYGSINKGEKEGGKGERGKGEGEGEGKSLGNRVVFNFVEVFIVPPNHMGWHINYEVEFDKVIEDWDEEAVKVCMLPFSQTNTLFLRDLGVFRVMLCVYSQHPIENILAALKSLYPAGIRYRIYESIEWTTF